MHPYLIASFCLLLLTGCSSELIELEPNHFTDTSTVTVTCDASMGNKGLLNYEGPVYVHLGLITDSSVNPNHWRYVKFKWGSTEKEARAKPAGRNRWSYTIPNIRKFFGAKSEEKIISLAVLFRNGNCIDTFCRVQRNEDKTDIFVPVGTE